MNELTNATMTYDQAPEFVELIGVPKVIQEVMEAARCVGQTFGPKGKPVLISPKPPQRPGDPVAPYFTRDGVTVIEAMKDAILRDPKRKGVLGPILLYDAADKVVKEAGDGTTTVCLLTAQLLDEDIDMRPRLEDIEKYIREHLVLQPESENDVISVAITAVKDRLLGEAIGKLIWELGEDGYVRGNQGSAFRAYKIPGYSLGTGLLLPQQMRGVFSSVHNHRQSVTLRDPLVAIVGHDITKIEQLVTIYKAYGEQTGNRFDRPLALVVGGIEEKPLQFVMDNFFNQKNPVPVFIIRAPDDPMERYEILTDLKFATGADTVYSKHSGKSINVQGKGFTAKFGKCKEIYLSMDDARFVVEKSFEERIDQIKGMEQTDLTLKRISSLSGAIGVIDFEADTSASLRNLELQLEDGVLAAQGCMREGYVEGGHKVWNNLAEEFPDYAPVFTSIAKRLPSTFSADSAPVIIQSIRSAASLAGELKDCAHVVLV